MASDSMYDKLAFGSAPDIGASGRVEIHYLSFGQSFGGVYCSGVYSTLIGWTD